MVNNLKLCEGLITRRRETIKGVEESAIDFFLGNVKMLQYITKMTVDEEEQFALTNIAQKKKNKYSKKPDHRALTLDLNIHFSKIKPDNKEVFNFKNESCQRVFKNITDQETKLIECLESEVTLDEKAKMWQKTLETIFYKSFTKIKVKNSKKKSDSKEAKLLDERKTLLRKNPEMLMMIQVKEFQKLKTSCVKLISK